MSFSSVTRLQTVLVAALSVAAIAAPAMARQPAQVQAHAQAPVQRDIIPARAEFSAQVYRAMSVETPPPGAARIVMPCEVSILARRDFERLFGQAPIFVTAEQALEARDRGETWSAPRCMTAREHTRLSDLLN